MEVSGYLHAPAALPSRERAPGTRWIGGYVGPRVGLDTVAKTKRTMYKFPCNNVCVCVCVCKESG